MSCGGCMLGPEMVCLDSFGVDMAGLDAEGVGAEN